MKELIVASLMSRGSGYAYSGQYNSIIIGWFTQIYVGKFTLPKEIKPIRQGRHVAPSGFKGGRREHQNSMRKLSK